MVAPAKLCRAAVAQVKQARTSTAYEKMVLRVNEWLVEHEYDAFCQVVQVTDNKYTF